MLHAGWYELCGFLICNVPMSAFKRDCNIIVWHVWNQENQEKIWILFTMRLDKIFQSCCWFDRAHHFAISPEEHFYMQWKSFWQIGLLSVIGVKYSMLLLLDERIPCVTWIFVHEWQLSPSLDPAEIYVNLSVNCCGQVSFTIL